MEFLIILIIIFMFLIGLGGLLAFVFLIAFAIIKTIAVLIGKKGEIEKGE